MTCAGPQAGGERAGGGLLVGTERRPTLGETLADTLAGSVHGDCSSSEILMVSGHEQCPVRVCACVHARTWFGWTETKQKGGRV